jgi:hypothetical protein
MSVGRRACVSWGWLPGCLALASCGGGSASDAGEAVPEDGTEFVSDDGADGDSDGGGDTADDGEAEAETLCPDPSICDDGIDCTADRCDLETGDCSSTPDDSLCPLSGWTCEVAVRRCLPPPPRCTGETYTAVDPETPETRATDEALQGLAGYARLVGAFQIGPRVTTLESLACLEEVEGSLSVSGDLASVHGLHALRQVSGRLSLHDVRGATDLAGLSALASVGEVLYISVLADAASLRGLESLTSVGGAAAGFMGGIYVSENPSLASLEGLDGLTDLTGRSVTIEGNPALSSLRGLDNLTAVQQLEIRDNGLLTDLSGLDSLQTAAFAPSGERIGGAGLAIAGNPLLAGLHGLESLTRVADLYLDGASLVAAPLDVLAALTRVEGNLTIHDTALTDLSLLDGIRFVDEQLIIESNGRLRTAAMDGMVQNYGRNPASDAIQIIGNRVLEQIEFPALTALTGGIYVSDDPVLASLSFPGLLRCDGLDVGGCPLLVDLGLDAVVELGRLTVRSGGPTALAGLIGLRLVYETVSLIDCDLANLNGLGGVGLIGALSVTGCASLTSLDGLNAVTTLGTWTTRVAWPSLTVSGNPVLTDLGLDSLTSVPGLPFGFRVQGNPALPTCEPARVRGQVSDTSDVQFCITGNLADGCSDDMSSCPPPPVPDVSGD